MTKINAGQPALQRRAIMLPGWMTWFTRFTKNAEQNLPGFDRISHKNIEQETGINAQAVYKNNLFWTPRFYQVSSLSTEFETELLKFKNLQVWEDKHVLALTQLILIEATRDTTFDVSFKFRARASDLCQFHGMIDALLYQRYGGDLDGIDDLVEELNKEKNAGLSRETKNDEHGIGFPLIPVFFPIQHKKFDSQFTSESMPMSQAVSAGLWCLEHMS